MPFGRVPDGEHPGRGDGEALRAGWIAQPACVASSSALLIGAAVLARDRRRAVALAARPAAAGRPPASADLPVVARRVLAGTLALNGLGSIGFHGPGDRISRGLHDASLWAVVAVSVAGIARGLVRDPGRTVGELVLPGVLLAGGALVGRLGRAGGRWYHPHSPLQAHAVWHVLAAAAVTLAGRRMFAAAPMLAAPRMPEATHLTH